MYFTVHGYKKDIMCQIKYLLKALQYTIKMFGLYETLWVYIYIYIYIYMTYCTCKLYVSFRSLFF